MDHSKNVGTYALEWLEPEGLILKLMITNNGVEFNRDRTTITLKPPFDEGYLDTKYEVTATTNVLGYRFPLRSTFTRFAPLPNARTTSDVYGATVVHLAVLKVLNAIVDDQYQQHQAPALVVALDKRAPGLPEGVTVNHIVTNDQYMRTNDPRFAKLVAAYTPRPTERTGIRGIVLTGLVGITLLPLAVWLLRDRIRKKCKPE